MKRKVQAQRKFAQGAFIPPSVSSSLPAPTPPEKRPDPAADHRNVFHNTMSANSLLDIVAFQNIHSHRKEVVIILERIENKKQELAVPATQPEERNKSREARSLQRSAAAAAAQRNNMELRSQIRRNYKTFKPVVIKRKKHKTKEVKTKRKVTPLADNSDIEDDKPLKYLMHQYMRGPETATRDNDLARVARARQRVLASPIIKRSYKLALRQGRPLPQAKARFRSATKTYEPEIAGQQLGIIDNDTTTASENAPLNPPSRDCRSLNQDQQYCPAKSKESVSNAEAYIPNSPHPSISGNYMIVVNDNLGGCFENVFNERSEEDGHFKVPLVPPLRKTELQPEHLIPLRSREASLCSPEPISPCDPTPCPIDSINQISSREPLTSPFDPIILDSSRNPTITPDPTPYPTDPIKQSSSREPSPCPSDSIFLDSTREPNLPRISTPYPSDPIILDNSREPSACPSYPIILNSSRDPNIPRDPTPCPTDAIKQSKSREPSPCPSDSIFLDSTRKPNLPRISTPYPSDPIILDNSREPSPCLSYPIILNSFRDPNIPLDPTPCPKNPIKQSSLREPSPCPSDPIILDSLRDPNLPHDPTPCPDNPIKQNSSHDPSLCPSNPIILDNSRDPNIPRDPTPCPTNPIKQRGLGEPSPCSSDAIILDSSHEPNIPRVSTPYPTDPIIVDNSREPSPCAFDPIILDNSREPSPCPSDPIILDNSREPSPCPSDPIILDNSREPSPYPPDPINQDSTRDPIIVINSRDPSPQRSSDLVIGDDSCNPSSCIFQHFTSIREIVDADESKVMCSTLSGCTTCPRVLQLRLLKRMIENPLMTDPNDVYEFNDSDDEMGNPSLTYRQNMQSVQAPSSARNNEDEEPLYLDILPETDDLSNQVLQILPIKVPNQGKCIMTVRVEPKSEANMSKEFSLNEHGYLLDQFSTMNFSDSSRVFNGLVGKNRRRTGTNRREGDQSTGASPIDTRYPSRSIVDKFDLSLQERINLSKIEKSRSSRANVRSRRLQENVRKFFRSNDAKHNHLKDDGINVDKSDSQNALRSEDVDKSNASSRIYDISFDQNNQSNHLERSEDSTLDTTSLLDLEDIHMPSTSKVTKRHRAEGQGKASNRSAEKDNGKKGQKRSNESHKKPDNHLFKKCKGRGKHSDPSCRASHSPDADAGNSSTNRETHLLEAPVFHPTEAEFKDPLSYIDKVMMTASKYGLCKVVAPQGFKPQCFLSDEIRFNVASQYIARLYSRWGPAAREMCAIKFYLASQSVMFSRSPLFEGIEVNLPKLYHVVQRNGGLQTVIEKKKWGRVAEEMRFTKGPNTEKKIDHIYVKFLLPYDMLADNERQELLSVMERYWNRKNRKLLERALNPLHRQKRLLGESESSGEDTEEEADYALALHEAEDCVVAGRNMSLSSFKKVAANAMDNLFPRDKGPAAVEEEYWRLVLHGTDHVGVNSASIDTGEEGYGFTKNKNEPYGTHPWNLKMLSQNSGNVLRSLGSVLGVTVPTLHLGMVFSTSCWHRDPHGLPWIEYMHSGPTKIWYGIPDEQSDKFRRAVEKLCPTSCQNKSIWLPSDITMIPPNLLREHKVSLSRVEQSPGEFIIVFPKAYSCSICTGFTVSESVYFATISWLQSVTQVFQEVRDSCEPTMFSLEQLLIAVARDPLSPLGVLPQVLRNLSAIVTLELEQRQTLAQLLPPPAGPSRQRNKRKRPAGAWNVREQDECEICRTTLFLSKVRGMASKRASVCLTHALQLMYSCDVSDAEMVTFYTSAELEEVLAAVQQRLLV